jgi:hypothetical protein
MSQVKRDRDFFEAVTLPVVMDDEPVVIVPSKDNVPQPVVVEQVTEAGFRVTSRCTWPDLDRATHAAMLAAADALYMDPDEGDDDDLSLKCSIAKLGTLPTWQEHHFPNGYVAVVSPLGSYVSFMALRISRDLYENRPMFTFIAYDGSHNHVFHRWLTVETVVKPQHAFITFVIRCNAQFGWKLGSLPKFTTLFGLDTLTVQQHLMDCEHNAVMKKLKTFL